MKNRNRRPVLTYALCHAAAMDAGNRSMRAAGRKAWNEDDYNACCDEQNRLMDIMEGVVANEQVAA